MKVAIVHEWFDVKGGSENVVSSILRLYPDADLFALVDFFDDSQRADTINGKAVTTSFIARLPFSKRLFRNYLFFFPWAIEQLDVSDYDLVISSSHAVAKGVVTGPDQLHICYSHSPMRYAWDMYFPYLKEHNIKGMKAFLLSYVLHKIRMWDVVSSNRVDHFVANSTLVQRRITKYYRRDSVVINPPVDCSRFQLQTIKEDYYLTVSRLVPYKKVRMIVEAFVKNGKPLIVAGDGPELEELKSIASSNITLLGFVSDDRVQELMRSAKAFVFAAYEDFGIVPVEAMACGTPVIAYGRGGILDTVIDKETGLLFDSQTVDSLNTCIDRFERIRFDHERIADHARSFDETVFHKKMESLIASKSGVSEVSCLPDDLL